MESAGSPGACRAAADSGDSVFSSSSCAHTSHVGTHSYAAPEQLAGGAYGFAADVFPLGLMLMEMLCRFTTGACRVATDLLPVRLGWWWKAQPPILAPLAHAPALLGLPGMERASAFQAARRGHLPPRLVSDYPAEADLVRKLLRPDPTARPTTRELLVEPVVARTLEGAAAASAARMAASPGASEDSHHHPLLLASHGSLGRSSSAGRAVAANAAGPASTDEPSPAGSSTSGDQLALRSPAPCVDGMAAPHDADQVACSATAAAAATASAVLYQGTPLTAQQLLEVLLQRDAQIAQLQTRLAQGELQTDSRV